MSRQNPHFTGVVLLLRCHPYGPGLESATGTRCWSSVFPARRYDIAESSLAAHAAANPEPSPFDRFHGFGKLGRLEPPFRIQCARLRLTRDASRWTDDRPGVCRARYGARETSCGMKNFFGCCRTSPESVLPTVHQASPSATSQLGADSP